MTHRISFPLAVTILAVAAASGDPALVDHLRFPRAGDARAAVSFTWRIGDRATPLAGVRVPAHGSFTFTVRAGAGPLTLELREFRTTDHESPAYTVALDGKPLAFRCREYQAPGPASAFVDLPDGCGAQVTVALANRAETPLQISEAFVYRDLEAYARERGLVQPMRLGPTVDARVTRERLEAIRTLLPATDALQPMASVAAFAVAYWSPEYMAQTLQNALVASSAAKMPLELQLITWWAGTPLGCDGHGGRWTDPEYQQVTYDPDTAKFGLSVPNCWSSTPWLTTAHPALNAFKAARFEDAGRMLRAEFDRAAAAGGAASDFPVMSLVMDNEVTYWGAGMPNAPPHLQADFNPALVAKARAEGVVLDPKDGVSPAETAFLRRNLRDYNRQMAAGVLAGLGNCPLRDRVYTHTFMLGWCFDNPMQATEVGVLNGVRLGGEWAEGSTLEMHRELGVPANINAELGGCKTSVAGLIADCYAAACDHVTLFNIPDEGLAATRDELAHGWPEIAPTPWRKRLLCEDFSQGDAWKRLFTGADVDVETIWPGPMRALRGNHLGQSNHALMHLTAAATVGKPTFDRLAINYKARAFMLNQQSADAYLAVRAGATPDNLREVSRIHDASGRFQVDLTSIAHGQPDLYLEFEFHPLGLPGWVCLFGCAVEEPWDCETLLRPNRSYRADRLRAESAIVAWRADAAWALRAAESVAASEPAALRQAREAFSQGAYRQAQARAEGALNKHRLDTYHPWQPPAPDRVENGEARDVSATEIVFDPYEGGFLGRRVPVAPDADIRLIENGVEKRLPNATEIRDGDDLTLTIRGGRAVTVIATRGSATGSVTAITPATAFSLMQIQIAGDALRSVRSITTVHGHGPAHPPAVCPVVVGDAPFAIGDVVRTRWTPRTGRIVAVQLADAR